MNRPSANDVQSKISTRRWWRQAVVFLLMMMELSWILPWYLLVIQISHAASPIRAVLVLGTVILSGYLLVCFSEAIHLVRHLKSGLLAILFMLILFFSVIILLGQSARYVLKRLVHLDPGAVLVVFATLWLWWRGVGLARETIRPWNAWRRFEVGILLFMAYLMVANRFSLGIVGPGWFFMFLFSGFMAVILARISFVSIHRGAIKNPFSRQWVGISAGGLSTVLVFASIIASALTGQYKLLLVWLADGVRYLSAILVMFLSLPALLLALLLQKNEQALRNVMKSLGLRFKVPTLPPEFETFSPLFPPQQPSAIPGIILSLMFWGVIISFLILIMLKLRRLRAQTRAEDLPGPESLLQRGEAFKKLMDAIGQAVEGMLSRLRPLQRSLAAKRIRMIYAQLMELCNELNLPRPVQRTPLEFLPEMKAVFSNKGAELELITRAYLKVRYGELPEFREEVQMVESAWHKISEEGKNLKNKRIRQ